MVLFKRIYVDFNGTLVYNALKRIINKRAVDHKLLILKEK